MLRSHLPPRSWQDNLTPWLLGELVPFVSSERRVKKTEGKGLTFVLLGCILTFLCYSSQLVEHRNYLQRCIPSLTRLWKLHSCSCLHLLPTGKSFLCGCWVNRVHGSRPAWAGVITHFPSLLGPPHLTTRKSDYPHTWVWLAESCTDYTHKASHSKDRLSPPSSVAVENHAKQNRELKFSC